MISKDQYLVSLQKKHRMQTLVSAFSLYHQLLMSIKAFYLFHEF